MTYQQTLNSARKTGASRASDAELMALYCADVLMIIVGAASPQLVWEGAQKKGMTSLELAKLALDDAPAVHDLMWL